VDGPVGEEVDRMEVACLVRAVGMHVVVELTTRPSIEDPVRAGIERPGLQRAVTANDVHHRPALPLEVLEQPSESLRGIHRSTTSAVAG
jgi:hypothetical protein